jgi:hypothetical protein
MFRHKIIQIGGMFMRKKKLESDATLDEVMANLPVPEAYHA